MTRLTSAVRGLITALAALLAVTAASATARANTEPKAPKGCCSIPPWKASDS